MLGVGYRDKLQILRYVEMYVDRKLTNLKKGLDCMTEAEKEVINAEVITNTPEEERKHETLKMRHGEVSKIIRGHDNTITGAICELRDYVLKALGKIFHTRNTEGALFLVTCGLLFICIGILAIDGFPRVLGSIIATISILWAVFYFGTSVAVSLMESRKIKLVTEPSPGYTLEDRIEEINKIYSMRRSLEDCYDIKPEDMKRGRTDGVRATRYNYEIDTAVESIKDDILLYGNNIIGSSGVYVGNGLTPTIELELLTKENVKAQKRCMMYGKLGEYNHMTTIVPVFVNPEREYIDVLQLYKIMAKQYVRNEDAFPMAIKLMLTSENPAIVDYALSVILDAYMCELCQTYEIRMTGEGTLRTRFNCSEYTREGGGANLTEDELVRQKEWYAMVLDGARYRDANGNDAEGMENHLGELSELFDIVMKEGYGSIIENLDSEYMPYIEPIEYEWIAVDWHANIRDYSKKIVANIRESDIRKNNCIRVARDEYYEDLEFPELQNVVISERTELMDRQMGKAVQEFTRDMREEAREKSSDTMREVGNGYYDKIAQADKN